ncbi:MAG: hypothetical protein PHN72_04830 [Bacilli bacterium]|nr:hypothetical protein [Bacilli bacterium]
MIRDAYVDHTGNSVDTVEKDKKWLKRNLIILGSILFVVLTFFITRGIIRSQYCNKIVKKVADASIKYAETNKTMPVSAGDSINLDLNTLLENNLITEKDVTVNKKVANGKIKITLYKKDPIVTVDLGNCEYCTTSSKEWSKEVTKKPKKRVVDVIAYYNYRNKTDNYTDWTSYYTEDLIQKDIDKKYNVRLPIRDNQLPMIANDAKIINIEQETREYYHYRDKLWMYYKDRGGIYTDYFSSEQPAGYAKADTRTLKYTEWSAFSTNYPEKKDYRMIENRIGYKWFYKKGNKKIYYKNGEYAVEAIGNEAYEKDSKGGSTTMYRYRDKQWRWYNGTVRVYSGAVVSMPKGYSYKDEDLSSYSKWSAYTTTSSLNESNMSYREEEVQTRYRYRTHYSLVSLPVLDKKINKETLETKLQQNIDDILKRQDIEVEITYAFKYKK